MASAPAINYVGGCSAAALSAEQRRQLEVLASSLPNALAINVHPTLEISESGDDMSGLVIIFPPSAEVDPTLISNRLWESLAVARVTSGYRGAPPADAHFSGKTVALPVAPAARPAADMRDPKSNKDRRPWVAERGSSDSFAGAFYAPDADDPRKKDYYLVVRSNVPQLAQDLRESLSSTTTAVTYAQLLGDKRLHHGQYVADRNAQRNLVAVAAACQVDVQRMEDIGSALASPDHAPPERAIPDYQQTTYSVRETMFKGKPAVALYYGIVPNAARHQDSTLYVAANPQHGIYTFPVAPGAALSAALPAALPASHKNAAAAKPALKAAGWNPEQPARLLIPLTK